MQGENQRSTYQTTAVEFDHDWTFARLHVFWYQDADLDVMIVNLLVRRLENTEAVESVVWGGVVKRRHLALSCTWLFLWKEQ